MSVNVILATDLNFGIGNENQLPWPKQKRDMDWFRSHTTGHVVIMGRRTWESIGSKCLPKRVNIVITSKMLDSPDHTLHGDMADIIEKVKQLYPNLHTWIIGGAEIYSQAIPHCDKLYLTTVNKHYKCDTYVESDIIVKFPIIEFWDEGQDLTFQIRRKAAAC